MEEVIGSPRKRIKRQLGTSDMKDDTIDYISYLPEPIMHHILSFLPTKDVASISVLSKTWWRVRSTFPILDFDETLFPDPEFPILHMDETEFKIYLLDWKERRAQAKSDKFMNFVDDSVVRFCEKNTSIQRFRLLMTTCDLELAYRVDHWIDLASACNVKDLYLHFLTGDYSIKYSLPQSIYAAKTLNVLSLKHCVLKKPVRIDTIHLDCLKELSLWDVYADEQIIQNFVNFCPSIENFVLKSCVGVKSLQLHGFPKLEKVKVHQGTVDRIDINAPNLRTFHFVGDGIRPCKIDMVGCKNLILLKLKFAFIEDHWFQAFISNFPILKSLALHRCILERVMISSYQLESLRLELSPWKTMVDFKIDAPNLCSFKYDGDITPFLSSMDTSSIQIAELKLYPKYLNTYRYSKLREYLRKFSQAKVLNLHIVSPTITFCPTELEKICISPVSDIKHMNLKVHATKRNRKGLVPVSIDCEALVDGLLWASHPGTLSVETGWSHNIEFLEALCRKLMRKRKKQSCCKLSYVKCWHHHLKGVKIERFAGTRGSETIHYRGLLELLPTLPPDQMIIFKFKW